MILKQLEHIGFHVSRARLLFPASADLDFLHIAERSHGAAFLIAAELLHKPAAPGCLA